MSLCLCDRVKSHHALLGADAVLMYYPLHDEVNVIPLLDWLITSGKRVYLPEVISETEMTIHRYVDADSLEVGAYGIKEPSDLPVSREEEQSIDVAIVPGMAFDRRCNRLGRGKGYYDRFLARVPDIYILGVCFPFQLVENVPSDENDVKVHEVITIS